jgi:hypothetical protein
LQQIGSLKKQTEDRKKEASGNAQVSEALENFEKKLETEEEADTDAEYSLFGLALPGKEHESLPAVASAFSRLFTIVEGADAAPTADMTTASEKWEASARDALGRWKELYEKDLTDLNELLRSANLKPLVIQVSVSAR